MTQFERAVLELLREISRGQERILTELERIEGEIKALR